MVRLRDPDTGCPWMARHERLASIVARTPWKKPTELADAIERRIIPTWKTSLGDLLFQVILLQP